MKPKLPKLSGSEYGYLKHFRQEKYLKKGHNLSGTMDIVESIELPLAKMERQDRQESGQATDDDKKKKKKEMKELAKMGAKAYATGMA